MQSKFAIDFISIEKQYDLSGYPGGPDINLEPEHAEKLLLSKKKTNSQHEVIKTRFEPGTF